MWNIINRCIKSKSCNNGSALSNNKDIVNGFNKSFVNVGPDLAKEILPKSFCVNTI